METLNLPCCRCPSRGWMAPKGDPATCRRRAGTLQLLRGDLGGSFSSATVFTFHRFYGSDCALQQILFSFFLFPRNSRQVQDCGGCSQEKKKIRLQGKAPPPLPVLPSPAEDMAILLITALKSLQAQKPLQEPCSQV